MLDKLLNQIDMNFIQIKTHAGLALLLISAILQTAHGQSEEKQVSIIGSVATGGGRTPTPRQRRPSHNIRNSQHRHIAGRPVTIHEVEPPLIPTIKVAPAVKAPQHSDEEVRKLVEEMISMRVIFLSATVYGEGANRLSKLRLWCDEKECEVITNINFNHFTGFGGFRVEGREYMQLVGTGNAVDGRGRIMAPEQGDLQKAHRLARSGIQNRYTVIKMDNDDAKLRQALDDLVTLYVQEKANLAAAYETRLVNERRRAAKLAADGPPPPKPIIIHFWERDVQKEQELTRQQAAQKGESK